MLVVNNLLTNINRSPVVIERFFNRDDCPVYPGAITTGAGEQDALRTLWCSNVQPVDLSVRGGSLVHNHALILRRGLLCRT